MQASTQSSELHQKVMRGFKTCLDFYQSVDQRFGSLMEMLSDQSHTLAETTTEEVRQVREARWKVDALVGSIRLGKLRDDCSAFHDKYRNAVATSTQLERKLEEAELSRAQSKLDELVAVNVCEGS